MYASPCGWGVDWEGRRRRKKGGRIPGSGLRLNGGGREGEGGMGTKRRGVNDGDWNRQTARQTVRGRGRVAAAIGWHNTARTGEGVTLADRCKLLIPDSTRMSIG